MDTYRLSASALLRLASIAATAPDADAAEILGIVQGAQPGDGEEVDLNTVDFTPSHTDDVRMPLAVPLAKPEE